MCRTDLFLFCFIFYFTLCTLGKQSYIVIHSIFNHILFFIYKKNVFKWLLPICAGPNCFYFLFNLYFTLCTLRKHCHNVIDSIFNHIFYIKKMNLNGTYMCRTELFWFSFFFFTLCTLRKHSYNVIHSIFNHFSFLVKKNVFHWYL